METVLPDSPADRPVHFIALGGDHPEAHGSWATSGGESDVTKVGFFSDAKQRASYGICRGKTRIFEGGKCG
jgi:hypothetical protein